MNPMVQPSSSTGEGTVTQLTTWVVDDSPAWSPDGSMVAYHRNLESSTGPPGLYITHVDGTGNRLLLEGGLFWPRDVRFSPDGTRLSMTIGLEVFVYDLKRDDLKQLTNTSGNAAWADWSPDSRFLVYGSPFSRRPFLPTNLYVIDAVSGNERGIVCPDAVFVIGTHPRWCPVGDVIAFSSPSCGSAITDIHTIHPDGTQLRCLTDNNRRGAQADFPRWISDGSHLVYLWRFNSVPAIRESRVIGRDGSGELKWLTTIGFHGAISPDSRQVVAAAPQDSSVSVLFVRDVDDHVGLTLRQLTSYAPAEPEPTAPVRSLASLRSHENEKEMSCTH